MGFSESVFNAQAVQVHQDAVGGAPLTFGFCRSKAELAAGWDAGKKTYNSSTLWPLWVPACTTDRCMQRMHARTTHAASQARQAVMVLQLMGSASMHLHPRPASPSLGCSMFVLIRLALHAAACLHCTRLQPITA